MADHQWRAEPQSFTYEIRVEGVLDPSWAEWFDGLTLTTAESDTTLTGWVPDMAGLHGILNKVRDLGLPLLEVRRTGPHHALTEARSGERRWRRWLHAL